MSLNQLNAIIPENPMPNATRFSGPSTGDHPPSWVTAFDLRQRYSSAGLAHSAAETVTGKTGVQWRMVFRPRTLNDATPFIIEAAL